MTIKEQLLQEIESTPDTLLAETLDFLRFLKTKRDLEKSEVVSTAPTQTDSTKNSQKPYRSASGRSILRHAGTWAGDDFEECLEQVYATRGKAKFEYDFNPFE